ncbi:MAG: radical SAM family heme chaperone HemW [Cyanobacteria bacterium P01_H01_bin.15]
MSLHVDSDSSRAPRSAYVHIPFCRRRCFYCDFPITVLGNRGNPQGTLVERYLLALQQEIARQSSSKASLQTVFFGGGTPSLLSPQQIQRILTTLDKRFSLAEDVEISLEIDPGTFTENDLRGYQGAGVNRFSLGVQAFQPQLLAACGRAHTFEDIQTAVGIFETVGIQNFSLDLISGLPGQTVEHWQESLAHAIAINPTHLSCYDLVLEPVTAFGKQYQPGERPLPDEETTAQMYRLASKTLRAAGYEHYEISNYAKAGYESRHNRVYWQNQPYFAFGMGAASYVNGQRFTRPRTRQEYYAWLDAGCPMEFESGSQTDQFLETLMLGLRLRDGVDLVKLKANFGNHWLERLAESLARYEKSGWLIHTSDAEGIERLCLSDPDGFLFSNVVLSHLFEQFDETLS